MEMMGSRTAAAAWDVKTEEKEMDLLLNEIPHVTSPQGQQRAGAGVIDFGNGVHGGARAGNGYAAQPDGGEDMCFAAVMNHRDDGGRVVQNGGGGGFHAPLSVGLGSAPLPASGPFVGSAPLPLSQAAEDPERQWLANRLRGLHIVDAHSQVALQRHSPPVKYAASEDVLPAHNAYYGYIFGAPGTSAQHEHLFADQAMAIGYVASRPQRFAPYVGFDGYGGFARGLDAGIGGFVINRLGNDTGIGWGQGLVHPDFVHSGQTDAEYSRDFFNSSSIVLDAYGVPVADNRFARGSFNPFEAGLMLDGKRNLNFLDRGRGKKPQLCVNSRAFELGNSRTLKGGNMVGVKGYIYIMAKDQNGCRFLQQKIEEGKYFVDVIFEGIIDHIAELMTNSFANYLVQKMLDLCDEEQRLRVILVLTEDPVSLSEISLDTHGTRVVQKLIETAQGDKQIALIVLALQTDFMRLVNDLNGNHVIQKCLTNFGAEENKFIFEAAATHCFQMAIHRHGCCVLQRCISSARGDYQAKLIVEVCAHGFELAQDSFGNYVVQHVLEMKFPSANAHLASQFKGRYVYLSKQKVSSNVVEKCLKIFSDNVKAVIIHELINGSHFEQLLQDPYANYVIYTALLHTRGPLNYELVKAIRPYEVALRTSPCCKRISKALSRR